MPLWFNWCCCSAYCVGTILMLWSSANLAKVTGETDQVKTLSGKIRRMQLKKGNWRNIVLWHFFVGASSRPIFSNWEQSKRSTGSFLVEKARFEVVIKARFGLRRRVGDHFTVAQSTDRFMLDCSYRNFQSYSSATIKRVRGETLFQVKMFSSLTTTSTSLTKSVTSIFALVDEALNSHCR